MQANLPVNRRRVYRIMNRFNNKGMKLLLVLFGNALCALGVSAFIAESGFIMGGVTGVGLFLQNVAEVPVGISVAVLNVLLFAVGAVFLGRSFAFSTLTSSVSYPIFLSVFQQIDGLSGVSDSPVLCAAYGGCLVGMGIGIVLRQGASTGGTDIPPLILNRKWGVSVSAALNVIDVLILALQLAVSGTDQILYGIMTVFLYTSVLDKVLTFGKNQTQVQIISDRYEELNREIQQRLQRGTTLLYGEGGHSGAPRRVLFSVVSNRELVRLKDVVMEIDPGAFIIINGVSEVRGIGFTIEKPRSAAKSTLS